MGRRRRKRTEQINQRRSVLHHPPHLILGDSLIFPDPLHHLLHVSTHSLHARVLHLPTRFAPERSYRNLYSSPSRLTGLYESHCRCWLVDELGKEREKVEAWDGEEKAIKRRKEVRQEKDQVGSIRSSQR